MTLFKTFSSKHKEHTVEVFVYIKVQWTQNDYVVTLVKSTTCFVLLNQDLNHIIPINEQINPQMSASSIYLFVSITANLRWPRVAQITIPEQLFVGWSDKSDQWTNPGLKGLGFLFVGLFFTLVSSLVLCVVCGLAGGTEQLPLQGSGGCSGSWTMMS